MQDGVREKVQQLDVQKANKVRGGAGSLRSGRQRQHGLMVAGAQRRWRPGRLGAVQQTPTQVTAQVVHAARSHRSRRPPLSKHSTVPRSGGSVVSTAPHSGHDVEANLKRRWLSRVHGAGSKPIPLKASNFTRKASAMSGLKTRRSGESTSASKSRMREKKAAGIASKKAANANGKLSVDSGIIRGAI